MEIRDQQFELLLQPIGGVTPLVFAQRLGNSREWQNPRPLLAELGLSRTQLQSC